MTWGEGAAAEEWARFYIEHSHADLYQWGIAHDVQGDGLTQQEGNSVPRWPRPAVVVDCGTRCINTRWHKA
jgi:hypothetical protein